MKSIHLIKVVEGLIGFSSGIMIGAGFIAILTVLGVIPRLIQLSHSRRLTKVYGIAMLLGIFFGTYLSFTKMNWHTPLVFLIFWGAFQGIFNGMLAAALVEILNVFPLLSKRVGVQHYLFLLVTALILGKIAGSLFQWLYFNHLQ